MLLFGAIAVVSTPAEAAINCSPGTSMDIGYTIQSGAYIKGSASYTSCPNRPISSADIWIQRRNAATSFASIGATHVTISGITTPSSKAFSPKDWACTYTDQDYYEFRTYVEFHHSSGTTKLYSNVVRVINCK